MAWYSEGVKPNPLANDVLAEVPAFTYDHGLSLTIVIAAATIALACQLQHRNAANNANVHSQIITVPAFGTQYVAITMPIDLLTDERVRVVAFLGIIGSCQVSIFAQ
jgi:hypothetical protein